MFDVRREKAEVQNLTSAFLHLTSNFTICSRAAFREWQSGPVVETIRLSQLLADATGNGSLRVFLRIEVGDERRRGEH
jgi:hypothetical protein